MEEFNTKRIQKRIYENKINHGFNVSDVEEELCLLNGEVAEFYEAYRKKLPTMAEELADVAIYLFGLAEILDIDLGTEICRKMEINEKRKYDLSNGAYEKIS